MTCRSLPTTSKTIVDESGEATIVWRARPSGYEIGATDSPINVHSMRILVALLAVQTLI